MHQRAIDAISKEALMIQLEPVMLIDLHNTFLVFEALEWCHGALREFQTFGVTEESNSRL